MKKMNAMTIDVEDYFQVSAFEHLVTKTSWDTMPLRVADNTHRLLDMFGRKGVKATFFMLGWVARKHPELVRRMVEEGHEVASHGMLHERAFEQTPEQFKADVGEAKSLLEDLSGQAVIGYRAPSFSFTRDNEWVYDVLAELGYVYSSSVYPVVHDHYGIPDAPRQKYAAKAGIDEIPLSTIPVMGKNMPVSGGGYFRLYPYWLTRLAVGYLQRDDQPNYIFYLHPWEIDPAQPRMANINAKTRFRHYLNLKRVEHRLNKLLDDFQWDSMKSIYGYA